MWPQFHDNCQEPRKLVRGRPWLFYFLLNWRGCMAHFANLTSVPLALPIIQRQGNIRSAFQRMANIVEGRIYVTKGPGNGESVCILKNHTAPDSSRVTREVRRALGWNDRCGKTHAELRCDLLSGGHCASPPKSVCSSGSLNGTLGPAPRRRGHGIPRKNDPPTRRGATPARARPFTASRKGLDPARTVYGPRADKRRLRSGSGGHSPKASLSDLM